MRVQRIGLYLKSLGDGRGQHPCLREVRSGHQDLSTFIVETSGQGIEAKRAFSSKFDVWLNPYNVVETDLNGLS